MQKGALSYIIFPRKRLINQIITEAQPGRGKQVVIKEIAGCSYPVKIIFEVFDKKIIVITCYPLKRGV